jgi:prepilin-type N-terminal cleavage/methylation domain-containing protein
MSRYFPLPATHSFSPKRGFTLAELLVVVAVLLLLLVALVRFQTDIFALYGTSRDSIIVEHDIRTFEQRFIAELRSAQSSDLGGYPIESATSESITFYTDTDANGSRERVRYFLDGPLIKKGVTTSAGLPLSYPSGSEAVTTAAYNSIATTTPLFSYFGAGYTPSATPLSVPIDVKVIRLVKVVVAADVNTSRSPGVITGTTVVTLRNLKDNL